MKSRIKEIYDLYYQDIEAGEKYWEIHDEVYKLINELNAVLDDEHKKILEELYVECGGLQAEIARSHYVEGFKTGLSIGCEVFGKE